MVAYIKRVTHILTVFDSRFFRRIFVSKRDENCKWRRLHKKKLHNLYRSLNIIRYTLTRTRRVDETRRLIDEQLVEEWQQRRCSSERGRLTCLLPPHLRQVKESVVSTITLCRPDSNEPRYLQRYIVQTGAGGRSSLLLPTGWVRDAGAHPLRVYKMQQFERQAQRSCSGGCRLVVLG